MPSNMYLLYLFIFAVCRQKQFIQQFCYPNKFYLNNNFFFLLTLVSHKKFGPLICADKVSITPVTFSAAFKEEVTSPESVPPSDLL